MFHWNPGRTITRFALLLAFFALLAPGLGAGAQARPATQAQPQVLKFERTADVDLPNRGPSDDAARARANLNPLLDAWRAAGAPADSREFNDYTAAEQVQQAAAGHGIAPGSSAPAQFVGEVRGSVEAVNGTPVTGIVFLVYYDSLIGYLPVDLDDLSESPDYVLGVPVAIDGPSLDPRYEVWYFNFSFESDELDTSKLYKVYGPYIRNAPAGFYVTAPTFDISNVVLANPGEYAREVMTPFNDGNGTPVNFSWNLRPGALGQREYYQICIYDPLTLETDSDDPVILCSSIIDDEGFLDPAAIAKNTFASYVDSFPDDYPFFFDRPYYWFVRVYETTTTGSLISDGGTSFYENTIIFLAQPEAEPPPPATPGGNIGSGEARPWTVLIYMAADNELGDINRLPSAESNIKRQWESLVQIAPNFAANANIVTYTDFYNDGSTQICKISVSPIQCQELGEQNSSDPAQLTNFINVAFDAYPAERTMLIFATHAHAVVGIGFDQSIDDEGAVMTPNQVRSALNTAGIGSSRNKFDIIFYNACLMANLETAFDSAPFANYLVASSNRLWVVNIYQALLDAIVAQSTNPAGVAQGIVNAYTARVASVVPGGVYSNLAAFDLSKTDAVVGAVSNLGTALDAALLAGGNNRSQIDTARAAAQVYDSSGNNLLDAIYDADGNDIAREEDAFVDIRHFSQLVIAGGPATVDDEAQAVINAINGGFIIASEQREGRNSTGGVFFEMDNASGLAVYFPNGGTAGRQATYNEAYLFGLNFATYNGASNWDNFLRNYIGATVGQAPGSIGRRGDPIAGNVVGSTTYIPMVKK